MNKQTMMNKPNSFARNISRYTILLALLLFSMSGWGQINMTSLAGSSIEIDNFQKVCTFSTGHQYSRLPGATDFALLSTQIAETYMNVEYANRLKAEAGVVYNLSFTYTPDSYVAQPITINSEKAFRVYSGVGDLVEDNMNEIVSDDFNPSNPSTFIGTIQFPKGSKDAYIVIKLRENRASDQNDVIYSNIVIPFVVEGPAVFPNEPVDILGTLVEPQIPYMVLHAPPGSNSSTEFTEITTTCRSIESSFAEESSTSANLAIKYGASGSAGFIVSVPYEFSVTFNTGVSSGGAEISTVGKETCITISNGFATNAMTNEEGGGDLFIGYGLTYQYGIYDNISIDPVHCRPVLHKGLAYWPVENSQTEFAYTTERIKIEILSQQAIADNVNFTTKARNIAQNQVDVWEKVLANNVLTINDSDNELLANKSFGGDTGPQSYSSEISLTKTTSIEYDQYIEESAGMESVAEVAGSGLNGGVEYKSAKRWGAIQSGTNQNSQVLGYTLEDGDSDDHFNVEIRRDPVYGTPIFKLKPSTKTSCPYQGGYQLDQPKLKNGDPACNDPSGNINIKNAPLGQAISVPLDICNESNETRTYLVKLKGGSNVKNALIILGGDNISNTVASVTYDDILAGDCFTNLGVKPEIQISQNGTGDLSYRNIGLIIYPECEPELAQEIKINIEFGDGLLDRCFEDMDADGIGDAIDNCLTEFNFDQLDSDGDGIGNACDLCPFMPNPEQLDSDNDGIGDLCDNCPSLANPEQLDNDGDNIGNACDACPDFAGQTTNPDGDGMICGDNCPDFANRGLKFDGEDDFIKVNNSPSLSPSRSYAITFEAWIKPTMETISQGSIASMFRNASPFQGGFAIYRNLDKKIIVMNATGNYVESDVLVPLDTWTHIAVVFEDHECAYTTKLYINGALDKKGDIDYLIGNSDAALRIGFLNFYVPLVDGSTDGRARYFKGSMDEIRVWEGVRSRSEIGANLYHELSGDEEGLVAYYPFNEGTPEEDNTALSTITDKTSNGHTGTLINFDGTGTDSNWGYGAPVNALDADGNGIGDVCEGILSLDWLTFTATLTDDKQSNLKWMTAQEQNVAYYEVERSSDGRNWSVIGEVEATNKSGQQQYQFTDDEPVMGMNFYRIRELATDDKFSFSDIQTVKVVTEQQEFEVYPNPTTDLTTIAYQLDRPTAVSIELYDVSGRRIAHPVDEKVKEAGTYQVDIQAGQFPKGLYIVMLRTKNGVLSKRLTVMN